MSRPILTPRQSQVARMRAMGFSQRETCDLIGVSEKTIRKDEHLPAVQAEIDRLIEEGLAHDPAAVTLARAMLATRPNGDPDWQVRASAAKAYNQLSVSPESIQGAVGGYVHLHATVCERCGTAGPLSAEPPGDPTAVRAGPGAANRDLVNEQSGP